MTTEIYGGFWRRFFAFLIDKTIVYALSINFCVIAVVAVGLGSDIKGILFSAPEEITGRIGVFTSLCLLVSALTDMIYFTLFHGIAGQTPGKTLFRLQVIGTSGAPVTTGTAFLRWVGYLISTVFFFLGFLWVAFDRRKQGWHDKIAMTQVVYKPKRPPITEVPDHYEGRKTPAVIFEPASPDAGTDDAADVPAGANGEADVQPGRDEESSVNPESNREGDFNTGPDEFEQPKNQ